MAEYSVAVEKDAAQLRAEEAKKFAEARSANETSDTYLLLTVLYGIVLFLAGISAAFERQRMRVVIIGLASVTLTVATIAMVFLPLAQE
jgi:hypothetical protein